MQTASAGEVNALTPVACLSQLDITGFSEEPYRKRHEFPHEGRRGSDVMDGSTISVIYF